MEKEQKRTTVRCRGETQKRREEESTVRKRINISPNNFMDNTEKKYKRTQSIIFPNSENNI